MDGLYPNSGWRFMRDLDLLVPHDRRDDAVSALGSIGYGFRQSQGAWPADHRHLPGLAREGDAALIELHGEPLPQLWAVCNARAMSARSRQIDMDGGCARLPSDADQLAHLIAHDRFDEELRHAGRFLLRSALETALLCRDQRVAQEVLRRFGDAGFDHLARVHLRQTARLFPGLVPTTPKTLGRGSVRAQMLMAVELLDDKGTLRRLDWFARLRLVELARSAPARKRLSLRLRSKAYYRHCLRRLHTVWVDG